MKKEVVTFEELERRFKQLVEENGGLISKYQLAAAWVELQGLFVDALESLAAAKGIEVTYQRTLR